MGYTTDFNGRINLSRALTDDETLFLERFAGTRRMGRGTSDMDVPKLNKAVGLGLGPEGAFFVDGKGFAGQDHEKSITNYNSPPAGQPSLWCQWTPTEDRQGIEWDGGEKFYSYEEWLEYIINNFLKPWGIVANGEITWQGEEPDDMGKMVVSNNELRSLRGEVTYR